jgi:hypothetical protein
MPKPWVLFSVFLDGLREVRRELKRAYLSRGYLLALAVFALAILFGFLAFSPLLASFVYPLF